MFKQKRGQITTMVLWFMIDLVLAIVIFFILSSYVDRAAEYTTFEKNFLARDIALLIDTLYAAPGNVITNYSQDTLWFTFKFDKNQVQIYDITENPNPPMSDRALYPFIEDRNLKFEYKIITPGVKAQKSKSILKKTPPFSWLTTNKPIIEPGTSASLQFIKTSQELGVNELININKLQCPVIETEKPESITLVPRTINGTLYTFTDSLKEKIKTFIEDTQTKDQIEIEKTAIILQITTGKKDAIKAYILPDSPKSRKLACLILNNILDKNPTLKADIFLSTNSILKKAPVALTLELGKNLQTPQTISAISDAFEEYYKK